MKFKRSSGILLHPSSLPGKYGIGDIGPSAHRWIDFLDQAGCGLWQVLPLNPTGYGDSPFQCFSARAGNPLLISLDKLVEQGVLAPTDVASPPDFPSDLVEYDLVYVHKFSALAKAAENFFNCAPVQEREELEKFC